jgi:(1->4)-alpha-D-glucan 1-alpha-D-glucosylmutase
VRCKAEIAASTFAPELAVLVELASTCAAAMGEASTPGALREALIALSAELDVYRTYATPAGWNEHDRRRVRDAARRAAPTLGNPSGVALDLLFRMLTLQGPFGTSTSRETALALLLRWQQFTGPLAAKGVEDTALYRDTALLSLCEVGSELDVAPDAEARLVSVLRDRRERRWLSLNATTTHDTKRGEDTRARIAALTHAAPRWNALIAKWHAAHQPLRSNLSEGEAPTLPDALAFYQTIAAMYEVEPSLHQDAGADTARRIKGFIAKSAREGKLRSNWAQPDEQYELACDRFIDALLIEPRGQAFRDDLADIVARTRPRAAIDSLALLLLKILAPGVPDFYQGSEFTELSLVDPDNRRAVDWSARRAALEEVSREWDASPRSAGARLLARPDSDEAKLLVMWRGLACRRWLLEGSTGNEACDEPIRLEDFARAPGLTVEPRAWITTCGERRCHVLVTIPAIGDRPAGLGPRPTAYPSRANEPGAGIDQLTGLSQRDADTASPIVVILEGAPELVGEAAVRPGPGVGPPRPERSAV